MIQQFNDLPWHDASLKYINVDRSNPGNNDIIEILVEWPDDSKSSIIEFYDCYGAEMNFNFGVVACESILSAECYNENEKLHLIRRKWGKMGVDLEKLLCFHINTNSTNSIINIYSLGFRFKD